MKRVKAFSGTAREVEQAINSWQAASRVPNEVYEVVMTAAAVSPGGGNTYSTPEAPKFLATVTYEG